MCAMHVGDDGCYLYAVDVPDDWQYYPVHGRPGWFYSMAPPDFRQQNLAEKEQRELAAVKIQQRWRMWRAARMAQRHLARRELRIKHGVTDHIITRELWPFI